MNGYNAVAVGLVTVGAADSLLLGVLPGRYSGTVALIGGGAFLLTSSSAPLKALGALGLLWGVYVGINIAATPSF